MQKYFPLTDSSLLWPQKPVKVEKNRNDIEMNNGDDSVK